MPAKPSALDEPFNVTVEGGEVVILGPDGFSGSLTIRAAQISARRLENAAQAAALPAEPDLDPDADLT